MAGSVLSYHSIIMTNQREIFETGLLNQTEMQKQNTLTSRLESSISDILYQVKFSQAICKVDRGTGYTTTGSYAKISLGSLDIETHKDVLSYDSSLDVINIHRNGLYEVFLSGYTSISATPADISTAIMDLAIDGTKTGTELALSVFYNLTGNVIYSKAFHKNIIELSANQTLHLEGKRDSGNWFPDLNAVSLCVRGIKPL